MDTRQRIIQSDILYGIPTLTIYPKGAENLPVVFYVHGLASNKRSGIELGDMLAEAGMCMVAIDAAMHGERLDERIRTAWDQPSPEDIYPFESGLDRLFRMFQIVDQTARDMETLINHFSTDQRMNIQRLGVCGSSMGGFAAFLVAARVSLVKSMVSFIAHISPYEFWQDALLKATSQPKWQEAIKKSEAETQKRLEYLEQIDPSQRFTKIFVPKPLLLVAAALDTDVPSLYNLQLYKRLQPFYTAQSEHLCLRVYPGITHRVVGGMREEARNWFLQYL